MARIRRVRYFDKFKLKKMISFLSSDAISHYTSVFMKFPFNTLHEILPLRFKFMPETYVLTENGEILGMITVSPTPGNPFRLMITRLFLEQNYYNAGKQLIEFIVAKYGAKGASAFVASIDESHGELLQLFIEGCGFRHCSNEQLWKMSQFHFTKENTAFVRPFKDSDSQSVAMLFNDSVITHFKHSIEKKKNEYQDPLFQGLRNIYKLKYVIEDEHTKTVKAYFSISTTDNMNYILDITTSPWYDCSYEDIFAFTINQINKRKKDFSLFVKLKKYTVKAEMFEEFLRQKGFDCVQTHLILVKDFYKLIKEPESALKIVMFNEASEKPVFKM